MISRPLSYRVFRETGPRRHTVYKVVFHWLLFRFLNLLLIWFISFFPGNNWCVWSWRESNIRTIDTCGYPGNIKRFYQYITNLLNPPRSLWDTRQQQALPFIPSLCSTLCQTLSEFYLGELSHNSLIWQEADWSACFCLMVSPHIFLLKRLVLIREGLSGIWSNGVLGFPVENTLRLTIC